MPKYKKRKPKWETEPNNKSWTHMGLQCEIVRHAHMGHLCGYVGVERDHPLFGRGYGDDIDLKIEIHGGLTFSSQGSDPNLWWFGFDCGHSGDLIPFMERYRHCRGEVYRDMEYVEKETNSLAEQLCNRLKWLVLFGVENGSRNI